MIVMEFIFSAICTMAFGVLFNIPRKQLLYAALVGALGWVVYSLLSKYFSSNVMAAFMGALIVGIVSEFLARYRKMPATVFIIPGIIPLVPGYGLYYSMLKIVESDYLAATEVGVETILTAIAISSAIIITTSLSKKIKRKTII